jgi:hypothetical protein
MKQRKVSVLIIILTLTVGGLSACTKIEDNRSNMERIKLTSEYLNVLGAFNSTAREFSHVAKLMQEKDRRMDYVFNEEFWSDYDEKRSKAVKEINALKNYQFEFKPFAELKSDFKAITEGMEKYNGVVNKMRESTQQWTPEKKKELYAAIDPIYADIYRQSKEIVGKIDGIYNRVFVVGEDKK